MSDLARYTKLANELYEETDGAFGSVVKENEWRWFRAGCCADVEYYVGRNEVGSEFAIMTLTEVDDDASEDYGFEAKVYNVCPTLNETLNGAYLGHH